MKTKLKSVKFCVSSFLSAGLRYFTCVQPTNEDWYYTISTAMRPSRQDPTLIWPSAFKRHARPLEFGYLGFPCMSRLPSTGPDSHAVCLVYEEETLVSLVMHVVVNLSA